MGRKTTRETSSAASVVPPGLLPLIVEKIVQMDDLKELEANTFEMWRAMARYEIQKEQEDEDRKRKKVQHVEYLQAQNDALRKEILIRDVRAGAISPACTCCCNCNCR